MTAVTNPVPLAPARAIDPSAISLERWLLCLAMPLSVIVIELLGAALLSPEHQQLWIESELGVTENATVLVALAAAVMGVRVYRARAGFPLPRWGLFGLLATAGALYFAGEEVSWGQQWFHWGTPETLVEINSQSETNLHNINPLFGRIPKAMLEIFMLTTGIYFALAQARRPPPQTSWRYWLLPTLSIFPTCVLALICRLLNRFERWADVNLQIRWGEVEEYLIACFLLIYLHAIWRRLVRRPTEI